MLFFSITRILRLLRESEVARLPAATDTDVTFNQAGSYVLLIEHPRFNMALMHADFALHDATNGSDVRASPVIFRTTFEGAFDLLDVLPRRTSPLSDRPHVPLA